MSIVSASRDHQRLHVYDVLSTAVGYPDERFFRCFPDLKQEKASVVSEYDRLFRARGIWLYTSEYTTRGEFQQANCLSDIMGFYRAFGLQIDKERPDALSVELEFMHFLVFKTLYAHERLLDHREERAQVCLDAQRKFLGEYLDPGARRIAEKIDSADDADYYRQIFKELIRFLDEEEKYLLEPERVRQ